MIKRLKPVLILLGVAAVLGILLWVLVAFVLPKDEAGEDKGNSVVLMETDLTEADSVEIKNTFDHFTLVQQAIDHYYVDGKKGYVVDNDAILEFLKNLGIMEHGYVHFFAQTLLYNKALGRFDVLKINGAKGGLHRLDYLDKGLGLFDIELDIKYIHICINLEK